MPTDATATIRARLNPLFVLPLMVFPTIWIVGLTITYSRLGVLALVMGELIFVAPVVAIILNYFWIYRLELDSRRLVRYRFYRWWRTAIEIEDITSISVKPGMLGKQIVFESGARSIRLMWRSRTGNCWPPAILADMFKRLASRGVSIDTEVWNYLENSDERKMRPHFSRVQLVAIFSVIAIVILCWIGLVLAIAIGATEEVVLGLQLAAFGLGICVAGYALLGLTFWFVERVLGYGDLPPGAGSRQSTNLESAP
jgi:hypothetical protein